MVSLRHARLEVDTADVAVRCHDFDVQASGTVRLASERDVRFEADELRAETRRDVHLNGAFIRLNCTPEGEAEAQALLAAVTMGVPQTPPAETCGTHDVSAPLEPKPGVP